MLYFQLIYFSENPRVLDILCSTFAASKAIISEIITLLPEVHLAIKAAAPDKEPPDKVMVCVPVSNPLPENVILNELTEYSTPSNIKPGKDTSNYFVT